MSTRIDDRLFVALLSGNEEALGAAWLELFIAARRLAEGFFGGPDRCRFGVSAEDVAVVAARKFVKAATSGSMHDENPSGFLATVVKRTYLDLWRRTRRQVQFTETETGNGGRRADSIADTAADPEQAVLIAQHHRRMVCGWCEWPRRMAPLCAGRPALLELLDHVKSYLRCALLSARPDVEDRAGETLLELAATADLERVELSLTELNAFILANLDITRTALDQRWRDLREIAMKHGIADPPGLRRESRTKSKRAPAAMLAARAGS